MEERIFLSPGIGITPNYFFKMQSKFSIFYKTKSVMSKLWLLIRKMEYDGGRRQRGMELLFLSVVVSEYFVCSGIYNWI